MKRRKGTPPGFVQTGDRLDGSIVWTEGRGMYHAFEAPTEVESKVEAAERTGKTFILVGDYLVRCSSIVAIREHRVPVYGEVSEA